MYPQHFHLILTSGNPEWQTAFSLQYFFHEKQVYSYLQSRLLSSISSMGERYEYITHFGLHFTSSMRSRYTSRSRLQPEVFLPREAGTLADLDFVFSLSYFFPSIPAGLIFKLKRWESEKHKSQYICD
jgi:hypothetical protein